MSLVGISIFSADDKYEISVTWVSSTDGSTLATAKFSSLSTSSSLLAEYVESALSQCPNLVPPTISCVISIPSSFPADECFDVLRDFMAARITPQKPFPPITHGQAYCVTLPDDNDETFIMFLDFSPSHVSSECLLANFDHVDRQWQRYTVLAQKSIATHNNAEGTYFQDALKKVAVSDSEASLDCIVLNNPPPSLSQFIYDTLSTLHPNVPITTSSRDSISLAAATYEYIRFNFRPPNHRLVCGIRERTPVSIATSTGTAVCLRPRIIVWGQSIILTTSMDDQRSVTVRLLLGNRHLAKDNLERGVVVLTGLVPMAKGTARIQVTIKVVHKTGWRDAVVIVVQQLANGERRGFGYDDDVFALAECKKDRGPRKIFMFPRFFNDIYVSDFDDDEVEYSDNADEYDYDGEGFVVGDLPL